MTVFEAYRQIKKAKREYGIPYSRFVSKKLTNATDDELKKIQAKNTTKQNNAVQKIAEIKNCDKDLPTSYEWFLEQPALLVEERIVQHKDMAAFSPQSINTVRLFTILVDGHFDAFAAFVRFGLHDITDNFSTGGIGCGVDPQTGMIVTSGCTKDGTRLVTHPVSGVKFEGFQIPHWDLVLSKAEEALRAVDGVNYVGWDVAIRENDVVFVEGNAIPDLGIHQALFAEKGILTRPSYEKYL